MKQAVPVVTLTLTLMLAACAKTPKAVGTLVVDPPAPRILGESAAAEALQSDAATFVREHLDRLNGAAFAESLAGSFRPPLTSARVRAALHATARKDTRVIELAVSLDDPALARSLCNWALTRYAQQRAEASSDSLVIDVRLLDPCEIH
jgi:hypothetical protein